MSSLTHVLLTLWATTTAVGAVLLVLVVAVQGGARRLRRRGRVQQGRSRRPIR